MQGKLYIYINSNDKKSFYYIPLGIHHYYSELFKSFTFKNFFYTLIIFTIICRAGLLALWIKLWRPWQQLVSLSKVFDCALHKLLLQKRHVIFYASVFHFNKIYIVLFIFSVSMCVMLLKSLLELVLQYIRIFFNC